MVQDIEDLKDIARRTWEEILPSEDAEALVASIHPAFTERDARPDEPAGPAGVVRRMHWLATVFADQRWEIHDVLGDGDTVAVHCTHHGRHVGELMGIAPTGKEVSYQYVQFLRFRDGLAIEHWSVRDDMTLMRQLGVIPSREAASPA